MKHDIGPLTIEIDGRRYEVEVPDEAVGDGCRCVRFYTSSGRAREVTAPRGAYEPDETCHGGLACTCPDFRFRHAGTESLGCKHIQAAVACRLIDRDPDATPIHLTAGERLSGRSATYHGDY